MTVTDLSSAAGSGDRHPVCVSHSCISRTSLLFDGNSNWRGPVWMPINYLIIESLQRFHQYYGDDFKVECPTGSGKFVTLIDVADELSRRLTRLFLKGEDDQRPVLKSHPKQETDPHCRDYVLFHEYFHGDTGRGVGASHQTGWTGLVARLLRPRRALELATPLVAPQFNHPSRAGPCAGRASTRSETVSEKLPMIYLGRYGETAWNLSGQRTG